MNPPKKLSTQHQSAEQQENQLSHQEQQSVQGGLEFGSADEMLRHDALHTPVPPAIGRRLQKSLQDLPPPNTPWWRRWLGGAR